VWWWLVASAVGLSLAAAARHDRRQRRRGAVLRTGADVEREAMHSRVDIDAAPYEPARHAGQRDWATYRRRDRRSR